MDPRLREIEYPDSDGEPISDTDANIQRMFDAQTALKEAMRRRGVKAYVCGGVFVYPIEGDPTVRNSPDILVAPECEPWPPRASFRYWEEPGRVQFAGEFLWVTERQTLEDQWDCIEFYRGRLGTEELFLYEPLGEGMYDGFRFRFLRLDRGGVDQVIEPDGDGWFRSRGLGLDLRPTAERIEFRDSSTGEKYLPDRLRAEQAAARADRTAHEVTRAEVHAARADHEAARADREVAESVRLERRVAQLEAELRRLRGREE